MARRPKDIGTGTILQAARKRFLQWGYSGTSIAALADDLGATKAALYYHFPDKEALFLAVVSEYLQEVATELAPLPALFELSGRDQALESLGRTFLVRNVTNSQIQHLAFQESRHLSELGQIQLGQLYHDALVRPLSALLGQASARSWLRPTAADEPQAIWVFLGLLNAFLHPGHVRPDSITQSSEAFVRLLLGALGPHENNFQGDSL